MPIAAGWPNAALARAGGRRRRDATPPCTALAALIAMFGALILAGCAATPPPRRALPPDLAAVASVMGTEGGRYWADRPPVAFNDWLRLSEEDLRDRFGGIMDQPHAYLLLSGGGGDGAFGAGLVPAFGRPFERVSP